MANGIEFFMRYFSTIKMQPTTSESEHIEESLPYARIKHLQEKKDRKNKVWIAVITSVVLVILCAIGIAVYFFLFKPSTNNATTEVLPVTTETSETNLPNTTLTILRSTSSYSSKSSTVNSTQTSSTSLANQTKTQTQTTTATTTRPTTLPSIPFSKGQTLDTHYFPFIAEQIVPFSNSRSHCQSEPGYTLIGLKATNLKILSETVPLVTAATSPAVWAGGYFNMSSPNMNLIYWLDGSVTDFKKAPTGIFCEGLSNDLLNIVISDRRQTDPLIVPIVRYKTSPTCLSVLRDFQATTTKLQPLCVMEQARLFRRSTDGSVIPIEFLSKHPQIWDKMKLHLVDFSDGLPKTSGYGLQHLSWFEYIIVGLLDSVPRDYAIEYCRNVRAGSETSDSDTLTNKVLSASASNINNIKESFGFSLNLYEKQVKGYNGTVPPMAGSTSAYIDFRQYPDYARVFWDTVAGTKVAGSSRVDFGFCDSFGQTLAEAYNNFTVWYSSSGRLTTGPNNIYFGLEMRPNAGSCLRLVYDELYWPGAYSWLPMCEKERSLIL